MDYVLREHVVGKTARLTILEGGSAFATVDGKVSTECNPDVQTLLKVYTISLRDLSDRLKEYGFTYIAIEGTITNTKGVAYSFLPEFIADTVRTNKGILHMHAANYLLADAGFDYAPILGQGSYQDCKKANIPQLSPTASMLSFRPIPLHAIRVDSLNGEVGASLVKYVLSQSYINAEKVLENLITKSRFTTWEIIGENKDQHIGLFTSYVWDMLKIHSFNLMDKLTPSEKKALKAFAAEKVDKICGSLR